MSISIRKYIPQPAINIFDHFPKSLAAVARFNAPARNMTVVGVTGTDGKTTTTSLIHHFLQSAKINSGMITTVEAIINNTHYETGFHTTTLDPWNTQKLFHQAKKSLITHMVIEATSIGLDQHRLLGIPFQIGVLTNITHDHLDYHKTYDHYLLAKAKLFNKVKFSILNQDDRSYEPMKTYINQHNPRSICITYGIESDANLRATNIVQNAQGLSFICKVTHPLFAAEELKFKVESTMIGEFNIYNLLAAISAGLALGLDYKVIVDAIGSYSQVSGRQERLTIKDREVIIDFAHTPNAFDMLLKSLKQIYPAKKIILVFGATGQRDQFKRPIMGEIACNLADVVILTADDTYNEPINQIQKQIMAGCELTNATKISPDVKVIPNKHVYLTIEDRTLAIEHAAIISKPGDVIVLLGKGHEHSINLSGVEYPWSEREAILSAINKI